MDRQIPRISFPGHGVYSNYLYEVDPRLIPYMDEYYVWVDNDQIVDFWDNFAEYSHRIVDFWDDFAENSHIYPIIQKDSSRRPVWEGDVNDININYFLQNGIYSIHADALYIERNRSGINWRYLSATSNSIYFLNKNFDKIHWNYLSANSNAISILEKNVDEINWFELSGNRNAISILEKNMDKINWLELSGNRNAISILEKNMDKINWYILSTNEGAISILEKNIDKINWNGLSGNRNAIHLLEKNMDKIDWIGLSANEGAISLLEKNPDKIDMYELATNNMGTQLYIARLLTFPVDRNQIDNIGFDEFISSADILLKTVDYQCIEQRMNNIKEELMATAMHPRRLTRHLELGGEIDDF